MKKGLSAVVATVLMILIVFVAIVIVWGVVMPTIKETGDFREGADLSVVTLHGYTVWDETRQAMSVQVKRGVDETNLSGIQFIFTREGSSITEVVYDVPGINQMKIYKFYLGALEGEGEPDSIKIAPVFSKRNTTGSITANVENVNVPEGNVIGSLRVVRGGGDGGGGGLETISLTDCGEVLNISGGYYLLENDVATIGDCFTVGADGITLDLGGHSLTGDKDYLSDKGIDINGYDNVNIKNGEIYDFGTGIYLLGSNSNRIEGVTAKLNLVYGIYLSSSSNNIILNNFVSNTRLGGQNPCIVQQLLCGGIHFRLDSNNNTLEGNIINSTFLGISSLDVTDGGNIIRNNKVNFNNTIGIYFVSSSGNSLISNNASSNNNHGIFLTSSSNDNTIEENTACNNNLYDFTCDSTGNSGTGNVFGFNNVSACDGWPECGVGLGYVPCGGLSCGGGQ